MPDELKPLLEKIDALVSDITTLKEENTKLKESIQKVTDFNRALLDRKVETHVTDDAVNKKFEQFMKGE